MSEIAILYAMMGFSTGIFVGNMDRVMGDFSGRPLAYPRLIGGIVAGLIWPYVLWRLVKP